VPAKAELSADMMMRTRIYSLMFAACALMLPPVVAGEARSDSLMTGFVNPPDSARPGVYWYFMDGNLSREGMTRDLEAMKTAGLGHVLFLEVNVGVPRGPVDFLSDAWQELFAHAVHECERLGIELMLGSGPGWTGSGGPWVKPEDSMQHLVASKVETQGPGPFSGILPVPPPRNPFFGPVPRQVRAAWSEFYKDVAVLAFPTPLVTEAIPDADEKALVYRPPFTSQPGVRPSFDSPAHYPEAAAGAAIALDRILDLTARLKPDGTLDWRVPPGKWTVMRFVSRNNGAVTRPAPQPGLGLECDKWDTTAFDAHLSNYVDKLIARVGPREPGRGWTMLHIDSWEMGAQNWTPKFREEFRRRRGYDPQPFYPAFVGQLVGSRELTERFLWDLRQTGSELNVEKHAGHLKEVAHKHGFTLSIEPYDMHPGNDFDFGAVADLPMGEFWSIGFNSSFSCQQASSIAHVMGRPVVGGESFTGAPGEDWTLYPGNMKNQGDWAFSVGINRFTYHTFAHKPDKGRPGMVMGPYGVHWDRGQTWWPMAGAYHCYITRCQYLLRQGLTVSDVLYLMPEGAPNVFQPPISASEGTARLPDRRGYNYDGCSATALITLASVREGRIVFPGGASYALLVLPNRPTMTPGLVEKVGALVRAGATVVGPAPLKSPSLVGYPACDGEVAAKAQAVWGTMTAPATLEAHRCGKGRILWGGTVSPDSADLYPAYDVTADILAGQGLAPDFASSAPLRYTHRSTPDREIYFIANRAGESVQAACTFRVAGRSPELWDGLTGAIRALPEYHASKGLTSIPLQFDAFESCFVVFPRRKAVVVPRAEARSNYATFRPAGTLEGGWDVDFDSSLGGPAHAHFDNLVDWTTRPEPGIQYFSGIAVYRKAFDLPPSSLPDGKTPIYLDLGSVHSMARIRLNGADCGVVWTAPWRVDITRAVKATGNKLEIEVANLWPNRMIGDARFPDKPYTQTTYRPYKASHTLLPSGLVGPVRIETTEPLPAPSGRRK
jgi:hypothetical protein